MAFNIVCKTLRPLQRFRGGNIKLDATRTYGRFASRRPVAIVNEDKLYEPEDTTVERFSRRKIPSPQNSREKERSDGNVSANENKEKSRFISLQHNDKTVTSLMTKLKSRRWNESNEEIILEGKRLIKDALKAGVQARAIFFNNPSDIDELQPPEEVLLYKVPYNTIQLWSSLTTSPGLIGIFKTPDVSNREPDNDSLPLTIIGDNIRDPGNMGLIMRAAAAVGCEKLILMKGCTNIWQNKVLRSAAGTHFKLPIHTSLTWDEIPSLISEDSNVFVADSNFGDKFITRYTSDELQPSMGIFDIKPGSLKENFGNANETEKWKSDAPINKRMMNNFLLSLPIVPYYSLDYTEREIVLVLSGETEGLSFDSYKFLNESKVIRINIPVINGVDSLNVAMALGIVMFEMKRQFIKRQSEL